MKKVRLSKDYNNMVDNMNIVEEWNKLFKADSTLNAEHDTPWSLTINESKLTVNFFQYFSTVVPKLLKKTQVSGVLKFVIDENEFKNSISTYLEEFLCGEEHNYTLDELSGYDKPAKYCGKVLSMGDPTYTCKDCAADPTCVFCHDCFHQSSHVNHRYKMHTSQGNGGYCDCGDEEAWSTDPSCKKHEEGLVVDESWDPLSALPIKVYHRARFLFIYLLQYAVDLICWQENDSLPYPLTIQSTNIAKSHIVVLFNDESHTYHEVTATLQQAVKATNQEAFRFAAIVDKEGRSSIYNDTPEKCRKIVEVCRSCLSMNGKKSLKCEAMHKDVVAHHLTALCVMKWLNEVVEKSSGLRRLLVLLVSKCLHQRSDSLLYQVIQMDTEFWKVARSHTHQLFMNALMIDSIGRIEFAVLFAKHYDNIMIDFFNDDHDHAISVSTMSVQVFTVPTLAEMLILKHNVLYVCLDTFWKQIKSAVGSNGYLDFQKHSIPIARINYVLHDIKYLMRNKPNVWSEELRTQFLNAFDIFVNLLSVMQFMDSVVKEKGLHVEYEPNWEKGFNLQIHITDLLTFMTSWCISDVKVLELSLGKLIKALENLPSLKYITVHGKKVVDYDIQEFPVSVHHTLSRFIASLIPGIGKNKLNMTALLKVPKQENEKVEFLLAMLEYPLRSLVLLAQVNSQMWKRNGYSILNQLLYYQNINCTSEMFDRDILLLQTMGTLIKPKIFVNALLSKYKLIYWFSTNTWSSSETEKLVSSTADEFFVVLFYLFNERYNSGIAHTNTNEILYREVTHRLSLGPKARSYLLKMLPNKNLDGDTDPSIELQLDNVLKEVATYREPGVTGKGLFTLKKEHFLRCNPYFIHFSRTERSKIQEERQKVVEKEDQDTMQYLHRPPEFHEPFKGLLKLLYSEAINKIICATFQKSINTKAICSAEQVELSLLIIAVGVLEIKRYRKNKTPFPLGVDYLQMITKSNSAGENLCNLVDMLCSHTTKVYHGCAKWVIKMIKEEVVHSGITVENISHLLTTTITDSKTDSKTADEVEHARKQRLAKENRAKMMAQMNNMQKAFMKKNSMMNKILAEDDDTKLNDELMEVEDLTNSYLTHPVAIGNNQSLSESFNPMLLCILCQEEESLDSNHQFVMTCLLHKSRLLNQQSIEESETTDNVLPVLNNSNNVNISSCGHVVHHKCWEKYYSSIKEKEALPFFRTRRHSCIDVSASEYLCPLCKSLCNTVLPLLPRDAHYTDATDTNLTDFLSHFKASVTKLPPAKVDSATSSLSNPVDEFTKLVQYYIGNVKTGKTDFMILFMKKLSKLSLSNAKESEWVLPLACMSLSYTLQTIECFCRMKETNIFADTSDRQMMFLYGIVQYLSSTSQTIHHAVSHLLNFFEGNKDSELNVLQVDMLGLLITMEIFYSTKKEHNTGKANAIKKSHKTKVDSANIFKLCLKIALIKIYLTAPKFSRDECFETNESSVEDSVVRKTWLYIRKLANLYESGDKKTDYSQLRSYVIEGLIPFLRSATLFYHFVTGVKLPEQLKQGRADEVKHMLLYLNQSANINDILTRDWLIDELEIKNMIERWCSNEQIQIQSSPVLPYVEARRLYPLPYNYSELINMASRFKCPTTDDCSRTPFLCLLCGKIICGQCFCCVTEAEFEERYGACSMHALECGDGVGLFLRIRDCEVVLIYNHNKGAFLPSPYLDEYGEPDKGIRRGNPLYLNKQRYDNLELIWLKQTVPGTIAQRMESDHTMLSYDWSEF